MQQQQFLSQSAAGYAIDPQRPLSPDTLRAEHDKLGGPRDSAGRRIWSAEIIDRVREARAARAGTSRRTPVARGLQVRADT